MKTIFLAKHGWRPLITCPPGAEFKTRFGVCGTLLSVSECRARVKLNRGAVHVQFGDQDFVANRSSVQDWAPSVEVKVKPSSVAREKVSL